MDDFRSDIGPSSASDDARHGVGFATLVAPLDGSPAAERAMPLAARIARLERAPLVLVRVVPFLEPPAGTPSHGSSQICVVDPPPEIADACTDAIAYLERVAERYGAGTETRRIVLTGDPFTQVVSEITRWPHSLVVLSAHAANAPSTGDRSELACRIVSLPGIHVLVVPHEDESGSPRPFPGHH